jgi:DNA (cytosine-5)-methyltransferase 1
MRTAECDQPPDNCPVCLLVEHKAEESYVRRLPRGVAFQGRTYHLSDFVLIRAEKGPCTIGYITNFKYPGKAQRQTMAIVTVRLLGRINGIGVLPGDVLKDEVSTYHATETEVKC